MISLCTVSPIGYEDYEKVMLESVAKHFSLISRIFIAVPVQGLEEEKIIYSDDRVLKFETPIFDRNFGHALGLHACIDKVETPYIFFTDPDLFYLSNVDEFYLSILKEFDLDYVGCSHHSALSNGYGYFPYVMSSLVEKSKLPPPDWMKGYLKFRGSIFPEQLKEDDDYPLADGKYLLPSPIPDFYQKLPNAKNARLFDTGNSLCLYGVENNWKWLSFQTLDCHLYNTHYYRSNLKIRKKFLQQNLLWHSVRSGAEQMEEKQKEFL